MTHPVGNHQIDLGTLLADRNPFFNAIEQRNVQMAVFNITPELDDEDLLIYLVFALKHHQENFGPIYDAILRHPDFDNVNDVPDLAGQALVYSSHYLLPEIVNHILKHVDLHNIPQIVLEVDYVNVEGGPLHDYDIEEYGFEEAIYVAIQQAEAPHRLNELENIVSTILDCAGDWHEDDPNNCDVHLKNTGYGKLHGSLQIAREKHLDNVATLLQSYIESKGFDPEADMRLLQAVESHQDVSTIISSNEARFIKTETLFQALQICIENEWEEMISQIFQHPNAQQFENEQLEELYSLSLDHFSQQTLKELERLDKLEHCTLEYINVNRTPLRTFFETYLERREEQDLPNPSPMLRVLITSLHEFDDYRENLDLLREFMDILRSNPVGEYDRAVIFETEIHLY